jgi:Uma2 family endonuclease
MATLPNTEELWSLREYLRTDWSPDREFVEGRIEERHVGEKEHSILQRYLTFLFMLHRAEWGVEVYPELRTQTRAARFRVPDVLVVRAEERFERYLTTPPLIAIEILSPEDSLRAMLTKAAEYRQFGVEHLWILDPATRKAYGYTGSGFEAIQAAVLTVPGTPIRVELSALFAELDR